MRSTLRGEHFAQYSAGATWHGKVKLGGSKFEPGRHTKASGNWQTNERSITQKKRRATQAAAEFEDAYRRCGRRGDGGSCCVGGDRAGAGPDGKHYTRTFRCADRSWISG